MGVEVERKFLVANNQWQERVSRSQEMTQGYLGEEGKASVRVRVAGEQAWLTIKSATQGMTRLEYEYPVPVAEGREILSRLTRHAIVAKTRYWVLNGQNTWELDVFQGENEGLVTAELELAREDQEFDIPSWLGPEVTHDARYYNSSLSRHPYSTWKEKGHRP
ncbi:MAG: CYTH domain-containing protein [Gammaproteobacteria bacterium]|nr:CYTH domain-containing protein [Gammaproteobacteria bacterium]